MAYRELFMVEIKELLRLWQRGLGYREVARRLGMDRKTVRRYVQVAQAAGLQRDDDAPLIDDAFIAVVVSAVRPGGDDALGPMRRHCHKHADRIKAWREQGCRGPKIQKLLHRHTGVVVPLRTLQRFVAEELQRKGRGDTVRILDPPPGQILEIDFLELGFFVERGTGRRRKMHALLCCAANSRHQFVFPTLTQTQDDVIEALEAAWAFFGGVFPVVICDNPRAIITKADPIAPVINPSFLEYAQARDFVLDPTRVRKPKDKARVERQVRYARDDFFRGEDFGSLEEARQAAAIWCHKDAGLRTHGTTRRQPRLAFEADELPLLKPVPSTPYDAPRWSTVHVGRDHAVVVDYALYSVPYAITDTDLRVRLDRASVKLYQGARLVKMHPRQPQGGALIDPQDLPPGKAELACRDGASLVRQAAAYGPHIGEYARRLLDSPLPWTRMRHLYRLLGLVPRFGASLVETACARALALEVVDVRRIDRMLTRGLVDRGLLPASPPAPAAAGQVLPFRFARDPAEYQLRPTPGDPDAPA